MQAGLSRTDRRLLGGACGLGLVLILGMATLGGGLQHEQSPIPSSYSGDSGGALGAYLLLRELGYPVQRWEQPPMLLPSSARVLILAEPSQSPGPGESAALRAFVQQGGRILFCGAGLNVFLGGPPLQPVRSADWTQYRSEIPSPFTRGADPILIRPAAYWRFLEPSQLRLYGDGDNATVVSWRMGQGQVLWWASATPLTNLDIEHDGNLQLLLNALSDPDGRPLQIYWDEYFHGRHGSLWSYIRQTPVVWGLLQTGFLAIAALFTFSRRSGPVAPPALVSRLSPLEFVDTMGSLYQRAGASPVAVDTAYRHLRLELARRLRLPPETGDAALASAAAGRLPFCSDPGPALAAAATARLRAQLPAKAALELVQKLENHLMQLRAPNPRALPAPPRHTLQNPNPDPLQNPNPDPLQKRN